MHYGRIRFMRNRLIVLTVSLFVLSWLSSGSDFLHSVAAQRPALSATGERTSFSGSDLNTHSVELGDGKQQLTVIDSRLRAIAVYHVDPRTGAIALKSVRNMNWDLQMDEFNSGGNPSPKDIRALLEQR
jgi:hypothetical protein